VALDLYLNTPATPATLMAALGPVKKVDEAVYRGVEEMLSGAKDPEQALEDAAAGANEAIAEYNERVEE
jgi:ABC-type glycerol-3-phosphate transport system substrate-binding protein